MNQGPGRLAAYIVFDAGTNPPTVRAAYGATVAQVTPLQQFDITLSEQVSGRGVFPGQVGAMGQGMMLAVPSIAAVPGLATTRILQPGIPGAEGIYPVSVCDATGALANAAAGNIVSVAFFKMSPVAGAGV